MQGLKGPQSRLQRFITSLISIASFFFFFGCMCVLSFRHFPLPASRSRRHLVLLECTISVKLAHPPLTTFLDNGWKKRKSGCRHVLHYIVHTYLIYIFWVPWVPRRYVCWYLHHTWIRYFQSGFPSIPLNDPFLFGGKDEAKSDLA
ncbi:hypothetical protein F4811DRAFT_293278 [Daldinia bambusicola]|nr:hypothetical protein F4811DRAFT_293278 [Daldinia bambusicola]